MLITKNLAFIHIPHTAGNFTRMFIKRFVDDVEDAKLRDWHESIEKKQNDLKDKLKFTNIRNPWDWYVSLYHRQLKDNGQWLILATGKERSFNMFIKKFLSQDFLLKNIDKKFHPPGNIHKPWNIPIFEYMYKNNMGFYSFQYMYICMQHSDKLLNPPNINYLEENHDKLFLLDDVCYCENLRLDLTKLFSKYGKKLNLKQKIILKAMPRLNTTQRKHYRDYYNEETKKIVEEKERLIINKYGYKF